MRRLNLEAAMNFAELYDVVLERKQTLPEGSGTTTLLTKGLDLILPKLNEECFEVALALEYQGPDEVALEVSQSFYYVICLSVFLGESFDNLDFSARMSEDVDAHELSKRLARSAALLCQRPCLSTIHPLLLLLSKSIEVGNTDLDKVFSYL